MKLIKHTIVVLLLLLPCVAFAQAGDEESLQRASEISNEIFSPFCPGKTLSMCPSPDAARVRRQIQQLSANGKTKDEIKNTIIEEYGEEFRLVEPPSGDNFGLFGGVVAGLGLAVFAVILISRRRDDDPPETGESDESEDDEYVDELRQQYRD